MAKLNNLAVFAMIGGLLLASQPSVAAIEIQEDEFGPSYGSMAADTTIGKPLQLVAALAGTATYVVGYPFAYFSGNKEEAKQKLVTEPWDAMDRCLGCTVAEDKYYKTQNYDPNAVRLVVDGPSELIISTNDTIIVDDMAGMVKSGE